MNNPILLIDPNGMEWFYYSKDGKSDPTWNWRDEHEYHTGVKDNKGNEVVLQGQEAVLTFDGSTDEKLGDGQNLFGKGAKLTDVTVYGPSGSDDIKHYKGFTMSSDYKKWGAIADGDYTVVYDKIGKSGALKSHWAINNRKKVSALDGVNPSPYRDYDNAKTGVFIHTSNSTGKAGNYTSPKDGKLHGITEACLLIVPSRPGKNGWDEFNNQLSGVEHYLLQLRRR